MADIRPIDVADTHKLRDARAMNPLHDFLMDQFRPGWRERREAQDPLWSFFERLVVAAVTGIITYFAIGPSLALHFSLHPEDRLRFSDSSAQLPPVAFLGSLLTAVLLLCLVSIGVNSLESLIPYARRRAETGSDRVPGLTITAANKGMLKAAIVIAVVAIPMDIYALLASWSAN
jgi:hypothetical protein